MRFPRRETLLDHRRLNGYPVLCFGPERLPNRHPGQYGFIYAGQQRFGP